MAHTSETLRKAFHYFFPNELSVLKSLVYLCPSSPITVLNIGAGAGTSGLAFLETRQDLHLHTVDITNIDSPFGSLYSERQVCQDAGFKLGNRWFQHHMDSKQLAQWWDYGPVDVCFIDGDHTYDGCVGDITGWLPHMRTGGFMAVHDYRKDSIVPSDNGFHTDGPHPIAFEGVDQAVDEFLKSQYEVFALVESLIVFQVK